MLVTWHDDVACRPATTDSLDEDQQMIGIPSSVALPHSEATDSMFFVLVCPAGKIGGQKALPFDNLTMRSQLGKGEAAAELSLLMCQYFCV